MSGLSRTTGKALPGPPNGSLAAGNDHLAQSIGDILTTPIGSRVMRRDYGSMLFELIDQPLNAATTLLAYASTALALRRWEPRLRLTRVRLDASSGFLGEASILIEGERRDLGQANARVTLSIPIRSGGATPLAVPV